MEIIDIGGRAHVVVEAEGSGEIPSETYAPVMMLGDPGDASWDGVSEKPSLYALLKKIALNTTP